MESLAPLPSQQVLQTPLAAAGGPAPRRAATSSPAADRRPSPPAASDRQPAGPSPLQATFRFEEKAQQVVVTLIRPETKEVVRQIPPDKILNLVAYLRQFVERAFDRRA